MNVFVFILFFLNPYMRNSYNCFDDMSNCKLLKWETPPVHPTLHERGINACPEPLPLCQVSCEWLFFFFYFLHPCSQLSLVHHLSWNWMADKRSTNKTKLAKVMHLALAVTTTNQMKCKDLLSFFFRDNEWVHGGFGLLVRQKKILSVWALGD